MDVAAKSGGVTAIVVYDYTAKEPDELDLVKGAIIHSIKQMPGGWWEGTLQSTNKTGMFPDNFVRVVDLNDDNTVVLRDKSATNNGRCKVIYSYVQVNDDELSLAVGDVIEFLGEVEEGWWRGRLKNKIGVFPSNFVKVIEPSPVFASKRPPLPSIATEQTAAPSTTSSASLSSKKSSSSSSSHRHSFHSSKEDLLSTTLTTTTINNLQHSHHTTAATSHNSTTSTSTSTGNSNILLPSLSDDAAPILPPKPQREYCRVEFPYTPQNDDELELKVGDIIIIHSTELPDRGWWKGELRGKIGVFPDNFVKLIPASDVSPLNDSSHQQPQPQQTHRTAKSSNLHATTMSTTASITSNNLSNVAATAKSIIKKSGSTSSTQSSNRKDSFGSRDSLNDILSETGLPSGNVAAQRKSLESKNFDLSSASDAAARIALKKHQHQQQQQMLVQQQDMKQYHTNGTSNNNSTNIMASSELRKSIENVDDKSKTTPPPVLSKKPIVPNKKTTTVSSVAGNIFSGLKQKVKSVESKLTSAASHDAADGLSSSKISSSNVVASNSDANIVGMRRAATIAVEDTEFDRVERTSILTDMRAGRVKAPKRRLPSNSTSTVGESNNNSLYVNGSGGGGGGSGSDATHSDDQLKSDDNSTSEELLAKPKPREWEKKKAPWMEELKASQVKKKTSPNIDNHTATTTTTTTTTTGTTTSTVVERTSKLFSDDGKIISSPVMSTTNVVNNQSMSSGSKTQTASTLQQQSLIMDGHSSSSSFSNYTTSNSKTHADSMSKSLSAKFANEATATTSSLLNNGNADDIRIRPNSLSLRNRSLSPSIAAQRNKPPNSSSSNAYTTSASPAAAATTTAVSNTISKPSSVSSVGNTVNNHHPTHHPQHNTHHHHHEYENNIVQKSEGLRLNELELRVEKLEMLVNNQQRTIEELVRALRDETDRVKVLRGELDKYAQCVTQV